jgi:hypothetical protein
MTTDLLARLVAAGTAPALVAEVALELARAETVKEELQALRAADHGRRERVREGNRERQERHRNALSRVTGVIGHDSRVVTDAAPLDKKGPQTPKEIIPPTPTDDAEEASSVPPPGVGSQKAQLGKQKSPNRRKPARPKPGSRLSVEWQAPAVCDLPLEVQAIVHKWPRGAIELTALKFRNHWISEGRAIGAKRDWPRTWCNWLINENSAILKQARAGTDFAAVLAAANVPDSGGRAPEVPEWLATRQAEETGPVRSLRQALRDIVGARTYGQWLAATLIAADGEGLTVGAPTQFQLDWIRNEFGSVIEAAFFREFDFQTAAMRWELLRPPNGS